MRKSSWLSAPAKNGHAACAPLCWLPNCLKCFSSSGKRSIALLKAERESSSKKEYVKERTVTARNFALPKKASSPNVAPWGTAATCSPFRSATIWPPTQTNILMSVSASPSTTTVCPGKYVRSLVPSKSAARNSSEHGRNKSTLRSWLPFKRPSGGAALSFSYLACSSGCFSSASRIILLEIRNITAKGVMTRIVALTVAEPSIVRSPKQLPVGISATTPTEAISTVHRPISRT
mmetsp:Transcript_44869/g.130698  ORF Transcript_44869/g.130698 Transcript_44869/m.130698 type:complete len:234 (+) Transcript_44869:2610-3311(+)